MTWFLKPKAKTIALNAKRNEPFASCLEKMPRIEAQEEVDLEAEDPLKIQTIKSVFYFHRRDHVSDCFSRACYFSRP